MTTFRKIVAAIACILVSLVICLLIIELTWDGYAYLQRGNQRAPIRYLCPDKKLGWRATGSLDVRKQERDAGGNEYSIHYKTNVNGFREFGNPASEKKKLLVIGDSFTQAVDISNSKTYDRLLADKFGLELFAYGGGGYGTLQEYMILDEFADVIKPQIVIWQFCTNDFINNDFELELASFANDNLMRRPYLLDDGTVQYRVPTHLGISALDILGYSEAAYWFYTRSEKVFRRLGFPTVEDKMRKEGTAFQEFSHSIHLTTRLIAMVRNRIPAATIVAFCSEDYLPDFGQVHKIFETNGIKFVYGVPRAIREAHDMGYVVKQMDNAHWNQLGHSICAKVLAKDLNAYLPEIRQNAEETP
jgi:hypothetical protein